MSNKDGSITPILYVALMVPALAISMVFFSLVSVFKGIIVVSSLAGAIGLSANMYKEDNGPVWSTAATVITAVLLYALSGILFINFL